MCCKEDISYLPPMTPFSSAANMRSLHSEVSTHDRSRPCVSALCVVPSDTGSALLSLCLSVELSYPPSCLPSLDAVLLSALLAALHRCGTMKALTPAPLTYGAGLPAYLATSSCRSISNHVGCLDIASPTTPACPASFGLRPGIAGSSQLPAESSSFAYLPVPSTADRRTDTSPPVALHAA